MELASEEITSHLSVKYGSDWNEVTSMCTTCGQLYVAQESVVDEVSFATLNEVRNISARGGECQMPHTVAPHEDGVVVSDPEKRSHRLEMVQM